MSLPVFPPVPGDTSIETSIAQILASIALEELALSHIINAEGEKIQFVLGTLCDDPNRTPTPPTPPPVNICELLAVNQSVQDVLGAIAINQLTLYNKMALALGTCKKRNPVCTEA